MNGYRLVEGVWLAFFILLIGAAVYGLVGCAPTQCIRPIVQIERPVLPTVTALELEPISGETYTRLRMRDLMLHHMVEERDIIIREIAEVPE